PGDSTVQVETSLSLLLGRHKREAKASHGQHERAFTFRARRIVCNGMMCLQNALRARNITGYACGSHGGSESGASGGKSALNHLRLKTTRPRVLIASLAARAMMASAMAAGPSQRG